MKTLRTTVVGGVVVTLACAFSLGVAGCTPASTTSTTEPIRAANSFAQPATAQELIDLTNEAAKKYPTYHLRTTFSGIADGQNKPTPSVVEMNVDQTDPNNVKVDYRSGDTHVIVIGNKTYESDDNGTSYTLQSSQFTSPAVDSSQETVVEPTDLKKGSATKVEGVPCQTWNLTLGGELKGTKEFCIDAQNRVIRSVTEMTIKNSPVRTERLYSKYGEPITITEPDRTKVKE